MYFWQGGVRIGRPFCILAADTGSRNFRRMDPAGTGSHMPGRAY